MIGGLPNNKKYNMKFKHENITWLNHKSYDELPAYLSWFDICFLPFKKCELIEYVNPCKIWEYLASGKEIIKTNVNIDTSKLITYDEICTDLLNIINEQMQK
jgi:glycosyltransferase involved in cell wall biosynthesis